MKRISSALILCLALSIGNCTEGTTQDNTVHQAAAPEEGFTDWGIGTIRGGFETVTGYFDSFMELLGGKDGVCQYRCRYGKAPTPRPDYKPPEPNGCSSYFLGLKMDMGIPAMTKCCNQLDQCYDTCGSNKYRCDAKFRWCLNSICSDLKRSLGFVSKVEAPGECIGLSWKSHTDLLLRNEENMVEHMKRFSTRPLVHLPALTVFKVSSRGLLQIYEDTTA